MVRKVRRAQAAASSAAAVEEEASKARACQDADVADGKSLSALVDELAARLDFPRRKPEEMTVSSLVRAQATEFASVLEQLRDKVGDLRTAAGSLLERFAPSPTPADESSTSGYAEVKTQVLLSYLICLVYYLLLKARGEQVDGHPVVQRLVWIRTFIEKLRPVDQRLQYQIGKLLEVADAKAPGGLAANAACATEQTAPMRPGALATTVEDEEDEGDEDERGAEHQTADDGVYRPPKVSQVEYTGEHVSVQEKVERDFERKKARLDRSEFMRTLRTEFTDAPTEVHGQIKNDRADKAARLLREHTEIEEDRMQRIRQSKKEARIQSRLIKEGRKAGGGVASLQEAAMDFGDIARSSNRSFGGRLRGRKGKGSALEEFQAASQKLRETRSSVASARDGGSSQPGGLRKKRRR